MHGQMFRGIEAVIFDLDGTLVDSMWVWNAIDEEYFRNHGLVVPEGLQERISGMSFSETAEYIKTEYRITDSIEVMKDTWNRMAEEKYAGEVPLKSGAMEFLCLLKQKGYRTGVATSNSRHLVEIALEGQKIRGLIDSVHTACEVAHGKPNPDIYLLVAEDLGVKPEHCLIFEDIVEGIQAGKNAGMHTCAIDDAASSHIWQEKVQAAEYAVRDYYPAIQELERNTE